MKSERMTQSFGDSDSQNRTMTPLQLIVTVKTVALAKLSVTNCLAICPKDIFISLETQKSALVLYTDISTG